MNFPFYISKRYLLAKKSKNVINIISLISVVGVAIGAAALIVILSVFNGFDGVMQSMYNSFDPDLKVMPATGKVFTIDSVKYETLKKLDAVYDIAESLEDNALLKYDDKQNPAIVKGVSENFTNISGLDTMLKVGEYILEHKGQPYAIVGQGVAVNLSLNINFIDPIIIYAIKRGATSTNPQQALNRKYIFPSAVFGIQQDFDTKYIVVPLSFARNVFEYENELSALEIKLKQNVDVDAVQKQFQEILGPDYHVKNRYQQHEAFYKIMKSEKFYIYLILTFILVVASFNIIGSLTMLIIDKKDDIATFRSLGANLGTIRNIFLAEGWLITFVGACIGLILGTLVCWLQIHFSIVRLQGSGSFIIDAYPVKIIWTDVVLVFITVLTIGFVASWYPVRYVTKRFVIQELENY